VHDISEIERSGVPGVFVASREFEDAAETQGRALGFAAAFVLTEHPIQDRTDDEMVAIADAAYEAVIAQITA
jgi:hypothetical protein